MDTNNSSGADRSGMERSSGRSVGDLITDGFHVMMPLLIVGLVGGKLISMLQDLLSPVLNLMPGVIFHRPWVRFLLLCAIVAGLLLLVGALARWKVARAAGAWLESAVLNKLPFYSRLRGLASSLATRDEAHSMRSARVTVDVPGFEQLGVIMERHQDGSATVFLPSSPNASSGTVAIVEASRIREVNIPLRTIVGSMGRYGYGTADLLEKAEASSRTGTAQDPGASAGRAV